MLKFQHLESFKEARKQALRRGIYSARFVPTTKLHGCNAGVVLPANGTPLVAQSRNRVLTLDADNYGFAAWVAEHEGALREYLFAVRGAETTSDFVVWGEWVGPGIQRGVACSQIPRRVWAPFAAAFMRGDALEYVSAPPFPLDAGTGIYPVLRWGPAEISLDKPLPAWVEEATAAEDARCTWSWGRFGVEGSGEGLVWVPVDAPYALTFKTKGLAHREVGPRPERPATDASAAEELAGRLCQPARLDKGLDYLREIRLPLDRTSTGAYLQWVHQDVQRECADELLGVEWKPVARCLTAIARKYLATAVDSAVEKE